MRSLLILLPLILIGCDNNDDATTREDSRKNTRRQSGVRVGDPQSLTTSNTTRVIRKKNSQLSSGVLRALEAIGNVDSDSEERKLFIELIREELELNGIEAISDLSAVFIDGKVNGAISSKDLDVLGEAISGYYHSKLGELELADILDASVAKTDQNGMVDWVATTIAEHAVSKSYPIEATFSLLRKQPEVAIPRYTAREVFSKAYAHVNEDDVLALLPSEIEQGTVFDEALSVFIVKKNSSDHDSIESTLEGKTDSFQQRSYYHLSLSALGYSDFEVSENWLVKITNPELRRDIEMTLAELKRHATDQEAQNENPGQ